MNLASMLNRECFENNEEQAMRRSARAIGFNIAFLKGGDMSRFGVCSFTIVLALVMPLSCTKKEQAQEKVQSEATSESAAPREPASYTVKEKTWLGASEEMVISQLGKQPDDTGKQSDKGRPLVTLVWGPERMTYDNQLLIEGSTQFWFHNHQAVGYAMYPGGFNPSDAKSAEKLSGVTSMFEWIAGEPVEKGKCFEDMREVGIRLRNYEWDFEDVKLTACLLTKYPKLEYDSGQGGMVEKTVTLEPREGKVVWVSFQDKSFYGK